MKNILYKSIAKSMIGRYAVYAINIISMMILARIFTPQDYGTVAALLVFLIFFQLMAEAGLGPALINLKKLKPEDRDGIFGLTIAISLFLAAAFWLLTPFFIKFYEIEKINEVVPYVAISLLFFSSNSIPNAILIRDQAYYKIATVGIISDVISTSVTVILTYITEPLHALASKSLLSAATSFFTTWYFTKGSEFGRPSIGRKFSAIKPLIGFSKYQLGFNFINYFSRNLDNILVGKYMGGEFLGIYDKAYQLMRYPMMLLTFAMTPAIQPVIRRYAEDHIMVEKIHRDFTFKLSIIGAAAGLAMYALADWIIFFTLGSQWTAVIPIIKILSISIPVQITLSTSGSFFQAMNRTDLLFLSGIFSAGVMITAIAIGVAAKNLELLCWCLVAAFHINALQTYYYMYKKMYKIQLHPYLIRMIPAVSIVIGMTMHLKINL